MLSFCAPVHFYQPTLTIRGSPQSLRCFPGPCWEAGQSRGLPGGQLFLDFRTHCPLTLGYPQQDLGTTKLS